MLALVLAAVALLASSVIVVWLLDLERAPARAVALGLIVAAQMQLAVLVAGALLGSLVPITLLLVQVATSMAVVGLAWAHAEPDRRRARPGSPLGRRWARTSVPVGAFAAEELPAEAGASAPPPPRRSRVGALRSYPFHVATFVAVGLLYLWHVGLALALPMVDYDGLALHGAAVAHWVTSGRLGPSGLSPMLDAAPLGPAAVSAWTATFRTDLHAMFLTSLGFAAIGAAAVAQLALRFGARAADAALGAAVFAAVPVVALQATSGYPDLAATSTVVAAWALWVELLERGSLWSATPTAAQRRADRRDLVLAGVALALAVSARPANLAAAALVIAAIGITAALRRRGRLAAATPPAPTLVRRTAWLLVPLVALGGAWYLRNALGHANPLHPFSFGPFDGLGSVEQLLVAPNRPEVLTAVGGRAGQTITSWVADLSPGSYAVDQRLGGFGPSFLLLLLPASAVLVISDRRASVRSTFALALGLLVVVPAPWWSRGTLFLPAVGAAALAAVASTARDGRRTALLAATLALTLVSVACTVRLSPYSSARTQERVGPAGALELARSADPHEVVPYDGYRWLDAEEPSATIALLRDGVPSLRVPLYGPSLDRRVVVLPSTDDPSKLARSMAQAGADVVLVPASADRLLDAVDDRDAPLAVVASGRDAPGALVVLAPR